MTPETIMAALEERGPLPRKAPRAAGECREAMVPMFPAYVDRLLELDVDALDEEARPSSTTCSPNGARREPIALLHGYCDGTRRSWTR